MVGKFASKQPASRAALFTGSLAGVLLLALAACGPSREQQGVEGCPAVPGTPWVPVLPESPAQSEATRFSSEEQTAVVPLTGIAQGIRGREATFQFSMPEELGARGSLQLVARVEETDPRAQGTISAVLVSLHDGTSELIKLPRSGDSSDCSMRGFFRESETTGVAYDRNEGCKLQAGSAYLNDSHWWRFQSNSNDRFLSVNTFPTCSWESGDPWCSTRQLRTGASVQYRAKFVILARNYQSVPNEFTGRIRLNVVRKKTEGDAPAGRLDINLVLVGAKNVAAARTEQGKRNLNAWLELVQRHYAQATVGVKIGKVRVFDWGCAEGGDAYATTNDRDISSFLTQGSRVVDAGGALPGAVNLFLVNRIDSGDSAVTILGLSGGIGGPVVPGTGASGVVFSTFEQLDRLSVSEAAFVDMGSTLSHEIGHFLGLAHLSERLPDRKNVRLRDWLDDTPSCQKTEVRAGRDIVTAASCAQDTTLFLPTGKSCASACPGYNGRTVFCPERPECEFNHVMWWTAKGYDSSTSQGDGNLFSAKSGAAIRLSPFVK